jgi:hypothetical protein
MSDPTPDTDELLRRALVAETDGVDAPPDLLDRIRFAATNRVGGRRRRALLAVAALAVVAGLATVIAKDRGEPQRVDVVDDPTTTTAPDLEELLTPGFPCDPDEAIQIAAYMQPAATAEEVNALHDRLVGDERVATVRYVDHDETLDRFQRLFADQPQLLATVTADILPTAYLVGLTDPTRELEVRRELEGTPGVYAVAEAHCEPADQPETADPAPPTARPSLVALARGDGWLVTVDLRTGEQRELHFVGDPTGGEGDGPSFIDSVDLSPDGAWVYFSVCCELFTQSSDRTGTTYRIRVGGGEVEPVADGRHPRVSPDGRYVATTRATSVTVTPTPGVGGDSVTFSMAADPDPGRPVDLNAQVEEPDRLAWNPAGTQLALTLEVTPGDASPTVRQVRLLTWDGASLAPADMGKPDNPGAFVSWTSDGTLTISSGGPVEDDRGLSQDVSYGWLLWVDEAGVVREQAGMESGDRPPVAGLPEALAADW